MTLHFLLVPFKNYLKLDVGKFTSAPRGKAVLYEIADHFEDESFVKALGLTDMNFGAPLIFFLK